MLAGWCRFSLVESGEKEVGDGEVVADRFGLWVVDGVEGVDGARSNDLELLSNGIAASVGRVEMGVYSMAGEQMPVWISSHRSVEVGYKPVEVESQSSNAGLCLVLGLDGVVETLSES